MRLLHRLCLLWAHAERLMVASRHDLPGPQLGKHAQDVGGAQWIHSKSALAKPLLWSRDRTSKSVNTEPSSRSADSST